MFMKMTHLAHGHYKPMNIATTTIASFELVNKRNNINGVSINPTSIPTTDGPHWQLQVEVS